MPDLNRLYRTFLSKMDEAEHALGVLEEALYCIDPTDENDAVEDAITLTMVPLWTQAYNDRMRQAIKSINESL